MFPSFFLSFFLSVSLSLSSFVQQVFSLVIFPSFERFWYERTYGKDEPDNWLERDLFGEDCASLGDGDIPTNVWFDEYCKKMKRYVCESFAVSQERHHVCN